MATDHRYRTRSLQPIVGALLALLAVAASAQAIGAGPVPPALLLAERYRGDIDVSRYWVSEKFDGVRASWNGKTLQFRSGNLVRAPK